MRKGFVFGVLVFGAVAATALAVFVRLALGGSWPRALFAFAILFVVIASLVGFGLGHRRTADPAPGASGGPGTLPL